MRYINRFSISKSILSYTVLRLLRLGLLYVGRKDIDYRVRIVLCTCVHSLERVVSFVQLYDDFYLSKMLNLFVCMTIYSNISIYTSRTEIYLQLQWMIAL